MKRAGFTMIEVLIAVSLVGLLLVALNTFIFSMGELWGRNSDVRLFDQHVRNVTRFMQHEMEHAALPPAGRSGKSAITIEEIKPQTGLPDNLLTFELPQGSRLISWPGRALPDVVCSLVVREGEGLLLLWHSRLEKKFEDDPPRESVITPLVTALAYDYYDPDFKRWKTETILQKNSSGQYMVPQRLRLKFTYDKLTRETMITLPNSTEGLPQF
ncbi:MAG: prepilin-type N-terminal cleavage/methylation domain-containing protein [Nibricoccus sp.]